MTDNRTGELIEEALEHVERPGNPRINNGQGYCGRCSGNWPCIVVRLVDSLRRVDEAVERVRGLHSDAGASQGYMESGYSVITHCCNACGTVGEYGIPWPCPTLQALDMAHAPLPMPDNPNQHCTVTECSVSYSHTAQLCGTPQRVRCGCPYCYDEGIQR